MPLPLLVSAATFEQASLALDTAAKARSSGNSRMKRMHSRIYGLNDIVVKPHTYADSDKCTDNFLFLSMN